MRKKRGGKPQKQIDDFAESHEKAEIMKTKNHSDQLSVLRGQKEILQAELEKAKVEVELIENRKRLNAIDEKTNRDFRNRQNK